MLNIKILPILLICFFCLNTIQSQTYFYLDDITLSPDPLTSADEICVTITGNKSTPCVYLEPGAGLTEVDGGLILDMCFQNPPCSQVLQPWDTTFCYGFLEPGPFELVLTGCNYSGIGSIIEGEVVNGDGTENPFADFSNDVSFGCVDLTVNFTSASVNADVYEWDFGDTNTSTEQNPTHVYTEQGQYTVTLTVYNSSDPENVSTAEFIDLIQIVDEVFVELGDDVLIPVDGMIELEALHSASIAEFLWSDGSTNQTLTVDAADLEPGSSNLYSVTVTSNNCTATDEVTVFVEGVNATTDKEVLNGGELYPNPTSDFLYFLEENVSIARVYDINGKTVGEWSNPNMISVKNLPIGVYMIELSTDKGVKFGRFLKM